MRGTTSGLRNAGQPKVPGGANTGAIALVATLALLGGCVRLVPDTRGPRPATPPPVPTAPVAPTAALAGVTAGPGIAGLGFRADNAAAALRSFTISCPRLTRRTDNSGLILALTRNGVGLGRVMDVLAAPLIRSGELVPVLQDCIDPQNVPIVAVMLQQRQRLPKIRACLDYWAECIGALGTPIIPV